MTYCCCCLTTGMTTRIAILRDTGRKLGCVLGFNRWIHSMPQSPPLARSIDLGIGTRSFQPVLPEFSSPNFSFGGSMELMAVPKRKVILIMKCCYILRRIDTSAMICTLYYFFFFSILHFEMFLMILFVM